MKNCKFQNRSELHSERPEIHWAPGWAHMKQSRTLWPERFEKNLLAKEAPSFLECCHFRS